MPTNTRRGLIIGLSRSLFTPLTGCGLGYTAKAGGRRFKAHPTPHQPLKASGVNPETEALLRRYDQRQRRDDPPAATRAVMPYGQAHPGPCQAASEAMARSPLPTRRGP